MDLLDKTNVSPAEWNDWRWQCAHALTANDLGVQDHADFPMRVTPYYASLAKLDVADDPIARQFLPNAAERIADEYTSDPFAETAEASIAPGIKQRFEDRILAMMRIHCSMYCRHCTRRGLLATAREAKLQDVVDAIKARPNVREILISGGDPLISSDEEILQWVEALSALPQLDAIRLCTRTPVVLPMRWTQSLVDALAVRSKRLWVQTQFNHPRELTEASIAACARLVERGIPVSNQSVLLRGVNDDFAVMAELCASLQRNRIRPYYIFQCDPIAHIGHFRTAPGVATQLRDYLQSHLGGLACPRVVADIPRAPHKQDL